MKRIAVVATGGTIAMTADEGGAAVPSLSGRELLSWLPDLGDIEIEAFSFKTVPSSHLTMADLLELKTMVLDLEKQGFHGVVITHGTDTLEETAYFLHLTVETGMPLVLTGAQRNPSLVSPDGPLNLINSIQVAADGKAGGMGVLVVFSSEIIPAREATKFHKTRVDTFKSLEFGPLGTIDNNRVLWFRKPLLGEKFPITRLDKRVDIIPSYLGADSVSLFCSIDRGADGIVLEALGGGHVPPAMLAGIGRAIEEEVPVVLTSRVPLGRLLADTYGYEGSEKHLRSMGVILGQDLPAHKARIKLLVLLSCGLDFENIREGFEQGMYL